MKRDINDMIFIPKELDMAVQRGIQNGKRIRRKRRHRTILTAFGSIAAVFVLLFTVCIANPTLAEKIPFIGKIFKEVESNFDYQGNYSGYSTHLAETILDTTTAESDNADETIDTHQQLTNLYGDTKQNITITPEEVFCDGISLYLGLRLTTADETGFGIVSEDYRMQMWGTFDLNGKTLEYNDWLIGSPKDLHTFIGMIKIPVEGISESVQELSIFVNSIFWTHEMNAEKKETNPEEDIEYHFLKNGGWNLTVPITIDTSRSQTYEINDVNQQGYGITSVSVTPYEIQIACIKPYKQTNEDGYYGGFAVFNGEGEYFQYQHTDSGYETFSVDGKSTEHLYFYFFEDEFAAAKCWDQQDAETDCIYKYELITK